MNSLISLYDNMSKLLGYPDEKYISDVRAFAENLKSYRSNLSEFENNISQIEQIDSALKYLERFLDNIKNFTREEIEELYTHTFDINPLSSLEIGWHLFGETYERGIFLVRMRELLRKNKIEESSELPDHLTHVLLALSRMDSVESDEFALKFLFPAFNKMLEGFKGKGNYFEDLLLTFEMILRADHTSKLGVNCDE